MAEAERNHELLDLTSKIVAAHLSNNIVAATDVPEIIKSVYDALAGREVAPTEAPKPAVPINKSITPTHLVCLEDGKKLKMLKRHLKTAYNMTPEEYREKWGLKPDYPMVAPSYAKQRSQLAKSIGLGQKGRKAKVRRRTAKK